MSVKIDAVIVKGRKNFLAVFNPVSGFRTKIGLPESLEYPHLITALCLYFHEETSHFLTLGEIRQRFEREKVRDYFRRRGTFPPNGLHALIC